MKKNILRLLCLCQIAYASPLLANNLSGLEHIEIDRFENIGPVSFYYKSDLCQIRMNDISVVDYVKEKLIGECSLSIGNEKTFEVEYSSGPSIDPSFSLKGCYQGSHLNGTSMAIPGDGFFYIWGHTDSVFNKRRMYTIRENKVVEVQTPYYYVGQVSEVLTEINLYRSRNLEERIISIPRGEKVEIVLKDGSYYLLKTSMDILGWWKPSKPIGPGARELKSLYFAGD